MEQNISFYFDNFGVNLKYDNKKTNGYGTYQQKISRVPKLDLQLPQISFTFFDLP